MGGGRALASSLGVQAYRGPNHVLVTRRSTRAALRARTHNLLKSRRWPAVHLHGLGAAIAPAIVLATELVAAAESNLVASCSTSTEVLVDHDDDGDANSSLRHNSALHISLSHAAPVPASSSSTSSLRVTSGGKLRTYVARALELLRVRAHRAHDDQIPSELPAHSSLILVRVHSKRR